MKQAWCHKPLGDDSNGNPCEGCCCVPAGRASITEWPHFNMKAKRRSWTSFSRSKFWGNWGWILRPCLNQASKQANKHTNKPSCLRINKEKTNRGEEIEVIWCSIDIQPEHWELRRGLWVWSQHEVRKRTQSWAERVGVVKSMDRQCPEVLMWKYFLT